MVDDVWAVDYIMRAECRRRRDGRLIWLYVVKWRNKGNFSCLRLPESDPLFERDPSIIKKFWKSTPFSPQDKEEGSDIVPPLSYIESCRAITTAYLESSKNRIQTIPAKRKPSTSPPGSSVQPFNKSSHVHTTELRRVGTRQIVVSDHSDAGDSLPDYEDDEDIVMQSAEPDNTRNQNKDTVMHNTRDKSVSSHVASTEIIYGPPVLGIDDDDLYAPHPPQQTVPEQRSRDVGPGTSGARPLGTVITQNITGSRGAPRPSRSYQNTPPARPLMTVPEVKTPVLGRERPGFGLKVNMIKADFPLEITDLPPTPTFGGLFSTTPSLDGHGFYRHSHIQYSMPQWREGDLCETAKVRLDIHSPATKELHSTWEQLKKFLYEKEMCLISFLPQGHAVIIFSSQSKSFGMAIGANKTKLGFKGLANICRVDVRSRSIPCQRYAYEK